MPYHSFIVIMATGGGRQRMTRDQMIQWMKTIPAECIPHGIRIKLSQVLDPPREMLDCDYRSFADRNGVLPATWQWLDSQKIAGKTSSFCLLLDYLQEKEHNYTVYQVYKTLREMRSDGERIILNGLPDIIRMYNQGTRPGQQNTEPPSLASTPGDRSPPPPYSPHGPQGSNIMITDYSGYPPNDLGDGCMSSGNPVVRQNQFQVPNPGREYGERQPGENSFYGQCPLSFPAAQFSRPEPMEHSFVPERDSGREPDENSCSFDSGSSGHDTCSSRNTFCPSCMQSQVQPSSGYSRMCTAQESPTDMMELKLPLEGPVVEVPEGITSNVYWSQHTQRASYPISSSPSYKSQSSTSRPFSDGSFWSSQQTVVKQKLGSDCQDQRGPQAQNTHSYAVSHLSSNGSICMDEQTLLKQPLISACQGQDQMTQGYPQAKNTQLNTASHPNSNGNICRAWQTLLSQPLDSAFQGGRRNQSSMPPLSPGRGDLRPPFQSLPSQQSQPHAMSSQRQSTNFVFILAADIEETEQVSRQVMSLSNKLAQLNVPHVAVTSTFDKPIVAVENLSPHLIQSLSGQKNGSAHTNLSLPACFQKAARVLMMVSPGYMRYADRYSKGAESPKTQRQKTIQDFHEELKHEFFDNKTDRIRVWPVLYLNADRCHLPSFLQDSVYFFYPPGPHTEDLLVLLKCEWNTFQV